MIIQRDIFQNKVIYLGVSGLDKSFRVSRTVGQFQPDDRYLVELLKTLADQIFIFRS